MKKVLCYLFSTWMLAWCGAVQADIDAIDLPLESLVEMRVLSMPKFADNADNIPSVVNILTRDDIRSFGWRTLGDALRTLPGFNVTNDHTYQFAGVRGISQPGDYRPRLRILIDGISVNENLFASAPVDTSFPLDLDLVERIEVVRGPSASVFGGDAMFGVINVVTRSGQAMGGGEMAAALGSGRDAQGRLSWGGRLGDVDLLMSATAFGADGRRLTFDNVGVAGNQAVADEVGKEHGRQLFLRARSSDWRVTLIANERERTVTSGSYDTIFNDPGHVETDRYRLFDLARDWRLSSTTTLRQRAYVGDYQFVGTFPYDYSPEVPRLLNQDHARGSWWGFDNQLGIVKDAHQLTFGLEFRADTRQTQRNEDQGYGCYGANPAQSACLDSSQHARLLTLFAQDEVMLGEATRLTAGLRFDDHSVFGNFWSPRLGVVYDAGQFGLLKALYGSAYRNPSVYERFYQSDASGNGYGNPSLGNERMESFELAWEKALGASSRLTTSVYDFQITGMITPDSLGTARNESPVQARGAELEFEHRWAANHRLRVNYSTQWAQGPAAVLDNSPRQMLKGNFVFPLIYPGLQAGVEFQHVDKRLAGSGAYTVPAYTLANMNVLFAPAGAAWEVSLTIRNLFDSRYFDPVSADPLAVTYAYPQLERSFLVKTVLRF